jgi:hypothetical protein
MTGFPLWAKDLRRAEIVAFGSFPFTFFFATTIMDTYRASQHGWDTRYAPWPVKAAGSIDMSGDEQALVITAAALGALTVALADFAIVQYKRHRAEREAAALPPGSPIIIRRPWPPGEGELAPGGTESPGSP